MTIEGQPTNPRKNTSASSVSPAPGAIDGFQPPATIRGWAAKHGQQGFEAGLRIQLRRGDQVLAESPVNQARPDITKDEPVDAGFSFNLHGVVDLAEILEGSCQVLMLDAAGSSVALTIYEPTRQQIRAWVMVEAAEEAEVPVARQLLEALARNPALYGFSQQVATRYISRLDELTTAPSSALPAEPERLRTTNRAVAGRAEKILLRRSVGLGDALMATPVLRRLRGLAGAAATIDVQTLVPAAFHRNPHVDSVLREADPAAYDRIIDLDQAYERHPRSHVIDAYMHEAFMDAQFAAKEMFLHRASGQDVPSLPWSRAIILHTGRSWRNRTFSRFFWQTIIDQLRRAGLAPVIVGSEGDYDWKEQEGVNDLSGQLSIHQLATVMERSACFVGADSGVLHVAGTTSIPIVGLFTVARPEYRLAWRQGIFAWRATPLIPPLECVGCLAEEPPPVGFCACRYGHYDCVEAKHVPPDTVVARVIDWAHTV